MAIPLIQIGQCGNQVGAELYETVWDDILSIGPAEARAFPDYEQASRQRFFKENDGEVFPLVTRCQVVLFDLPNFQGENDD